MKRIGPVMLIVALAGFGCTPTTFLRDDQKPPPVQLKEAPPAPPVTAEEVTAQNAVEKIEQLREEMKRDAKRSPKVPAEKD